ncbi:type II secretion system F family protein [Thermoproteota archaeon]
MKTFVYTFQSGPNKTEKGRVKANTLAQARSYLKQHKAIPLSLKEEREFFLFKLFKERKVKTDDIVVFSQLFASCIQTGLTLKDSLTLLSKQVESRLLRDRIAEIIVDIEGGQPISAAFANHTDVFPVFYPMLLKAGEASGDLAGILDYIGQYLERIATIKKELASVFTYPSIVAVVGMGLLSVILIYVAPTFKQVFAESSIALPLPTQLLFILSDILLKYLFHVFAIIGIIVSAFFIMKRTTRGKRLLHQFYIVTPMFGRLIKQALILRFLRAFEVLINNNVPILEALKVLEEGTENIPFKEIVKEMRLDVSKGLPISGPLLKHRTIFMPLISNSIAMGEKSGNLGLTLKRLSNFIDRELGFSLKKLSSRLDPALTMGLGLMVLFIALAIYMPIFDMMARTV